MASSDETNIEGHTIQSLGNKVQKVSVLDDADTRSDEEVEADQRLSEDNRVSGDGFSSENSGNHGDCAVTTGLDVDVSNEGEPDSSVGSGKDVTSDGAPESRTAAVQDTEQEGEEEDFEQCLGSDSSESEGEYESADEGEEIKVDTQTLKDLEDSLTDEQKEERRQTAQQMKDEGNTLFKSGSYKSALKMYSRALRTCPLKFAKERSIMYSNRSACKMKLDDNEACIKDCSKAIELHPLYLKPLMRRAELYEKTEKLDEALADYQKIIELDPSQHAARAACMRLPEQIKERNEKLKEEMMGKLKDLGNMVLRPFGLSTANFQLNQDPNTGGYSVNFNQNPGQNS